ncbi:30S ribosomal protein S11 [Patescibacteria group bacterium]|nr:30S ribosomal protein S11 [Patescibacteria group bacterium]
MGKKRVIKKGAEELETERKTVEQKATPQVETVSSAKKGKEGRLYISVSYNNTLLTLTDELGNALVQASAGSVGFKGTRKSTPFAASRVVETLVQAALSKGVNKIRVFVKGVGPGRDSALRTLATKPLEMLSVTDITPIPHNGPTRKGPRRV